MTTDKELGGLELDEELVNDDDEGDDKDAKSVDDLKTREYKAVEKVLSSSSLRSRDAAVLFQIARRVLASPSKSL